MSASRLTQCCVHLRIIFLPPTEHQKQTISGKRARKLPEHTHMSGRNYKNKLIFNSQAYSTHKCNELKKLYLSPHGAAEGPNPIRWRTECLSTSAKLQML
jgi:hypothetical protein